MALNLVEHAEIVAYECTGGKLTSNIKSHSFKHEIIVIHVFFLLLSFSFICRNSVLLYKHPLQIRLCAPISAQTDTPIYYTCTSNVCVFF